MDFVEASNIDLQRESDHWWIRTRFQYIDLALQTIKEDQISVLEIGCGTAQNLAYLRNQSPFKNKIQRLVGVDLHLPENFSRSDLGGKDILTSKMDAIPTDEKFDLLMLLDVIEHVEDPVALLNIYKPFLKPNGKLLILVPAFQSLWSSHDVVLGHIKRYTRPILKEEACAAGFKPLFEGYLFSIFFPVVYLIRKLFRGSSEDNPETDLKLPNPIINGVCYFLGVLERKFGNLLPFGTSVFGVYELDK